MLKGFRSFYNNLEEKIGVLRQFRIVTFIIIAFTGVAMVYYITGFTKTYVLQPRNYVFERLAKATAFAAKTSITNRLSKDDFKWPASEATKDRFREYITMDFVGDKNREIMTGDTINAVKIWNKDDIIIYDSNNKATGAKSEHPEFKGAFSSKLGATIEQISSDNKKNIERDLIEVFIPIILKGENAPSGAMEVYINSTSIRNFSNYIIAGIILITILGLIFLYLSLSWLFSRAHRRVAESNSRFQELSERLMVSLKEVEDAYIGNIHALTMAIDAKDHYTAGHSFRVASLSREIGKALGLSKKALDDLEKGARCHDIGKVGIKDEILNKHGTLTKEEYKEMKKHPVIGANIIGSVNFLKEIAPIIKWHHERLDGSGYPDKLSKVNIPLAARIVAVADVFDAMTTDRPNRKALSVDIAIKELTQGSGKIYDKEVVKALVKMYRGTSFFNGEYIDVQDSFPPKDRSLKKIEKIKSIINAKENFNRHKKKKNNHKESA